MRETDGAGLALTGVVVIVGNRNRGQQQTYGEEQRAFRSGCFHDGGNDPDRFMDENSFRNAIVSFSRRNFLLSHTVVPSVKTIVRDIVQDCSGKYTVVLLSDGSSLKLTGIIESARASVLPLLTAVEKGKGRSEASRKKEMKMYCKEFF